MPQSPERETLDQLLGGDLPLSVVRRVYDADDPFTRGILRLLQGEDVRLLDASGADVPRWRWRELLERGEVLASLPQYVLRNTPAGAAKVS
jgi:hypothetical protein